MVSVSQQRREGRALWFVAAALACSVTLTNQMWVGRMTIYSSDQETKRERLHQAILSNRPPNGTTSWSSTGANGLNIRLLTVWTAEGLHRATGLTIARCYFIIETCATFACCLLLFAFLGSCVGPAFALGGLLYFGSMLPLTYLFHFFHPWDKPSLAAWLLALMCTMRQKWVALALVLAIGVVIKYDILLFPLFVFLAEFRRSGWRAAALVAAPLAAVTLSGYVLLQWISPGGLEPRDLMGLVSHNLADLRNLGVKYPPLIGLAVPAVLSLFGYSLANDFGRAGVQFSIVLAVILFLQTNFVEFRAEVPILVLLLPAASVGLERLAGGALTATPATPGALATAESETIPYAGRRSSA